MHLFFRVIGRPLLPAGYSVCIFAYGQTGSGKTHTMSGTDVETPEGRGINFRALDDLFALRESRKSEVSLLAVTPQKCKEGSFIAPGLSLALRCHGKLASFQASVTAIMRFILVRVRQDCSL